MAGRRLELSRFLNCLHIKLTILYISTPPLKSNMSYYILICYGVYKIFAQSYSYTLLTPVRVSTCITTSNILTVERLVHYTSHMCISPSLEKRASDREAHTPIPTACHTHSRYLYTTSPLCIFLMPIHARMHSCLRAMYTHLHSHNAHILYCMRITHAAFAHVHD